MWLLLKENLVQNDILVVQALLLRIALLGKGEIICPGHFHIHMMIFRVI